MDRYEEKCSNENCNVHQVRKDIEARPHNAATTGHNNTNNDQKNKWDKILKSRSYCDPRDEGLLKEW